MTQVGFSDIRVTSSATNQSCFARIYYPTAQTRLRSSCWLPSYKYLIGISKYANLRPSWLLNPLAPVLNSLLIKRQKGFIENALPCNTSGSSELIVFSHGLGGFRGMYSVFAYEMVKKGYTVLAIEHGDGSACYAETETSTSKGKFNGIYYAGYPSTNAWEFRSQQLSHRCGEIDVILSWLSQNQDGTSGNFVIDTSFPVDTQRFSKVHFAGHSFGACTCLYYVTRNKLSGKKLLLMDTWFEPLAKTQMEISLKDIKFSMNENEFVSINSDSFHWDSNIEISKEILNVGVGEEIGERDVVKVVKNSAFAIKNSKHVEFSDIPHRVAFFKGGENVLSTSASLFYQFLSQ